MKFLAASTLLGLVVAAPSTVNTRTDESIVFEFIGAADVVANPGGQPFTVNGVAQDITIYDPQLAALSISQASATWINSDAKCCPRGVDGLPACFVVGPDCTVVNVGPPQTLYQMCCVGDVYMSDAEVQQICYGYY